MANSHKALAKLLLEQLGEAQQTILTLRVQLAESEERSRTAKSVPTRAHPSFEDLHAKEKLMEAIKGKADAEKGRAEAEKKAGAAVCRLQVLQSQTTEEEAGLRQLLAQKDVEIGRLEERVADLGKKFCAAKASSAKPTVNATPTAASKPKASIVPMAIPIPKVPAAKALPTRKQSTRAGAAQADGKKTFGERTSTESTVTAATPSNCSGDIDGFERGTGPAKRASATKARQSFVCDDEDTDDEEALPTFMNVKQEIFNGAATKKRKHDQCGVESANQCTPTKPTAPPTKMSRLPDRATKTTASTQGTPSSQPGKRESFSRRQSLAETSDFNFKMITVYTNDARTLFQGYLSSELDDCVGEFWELLSPLKDAWESKAGADWAWEFERKSSSSTSRVCVTSRLQRVSTVWREGDAGFYACTNCAENGQPCFTWAGKEEGFHCLPLHEHDRAMKIEEGLEIRYWVNER